MTVGNNRENRGNNGGNRGNNRGDSEFIMVHTAEIICKIYTCTFRVSMCEQDISLKTAFH